MSTTLTPKPATSNRNDRQPCDRPAGKGSEKVTLDSFWFEAMPFICLVVLLGIIVYLVSWN